MRAVKPEDLALFTSDELAQELLTRYEPCVVAWYRAPNPDDGNPMMQIHAHVATMPEVIRTAVLMGNVEQGLRVAAKAAAEKSDPYPLEDTLEDWEDGDVDIELEEPE